MTELERLFRYTENLPFVSEVLKALSHAGLYLQCEVAGERTIFQVEVSVERGLGDDARHTVGAW